MNFITKIWLNKTEKKQLYVAYNINRHIVSDFYFSCFSFRFQLAELDHESVLSSLYQKLYLRPENKLYTYTISHGKYSVQRLENKMRYWLLIAQRFIG